MQIYADVLGHPMLVTGSPPTPALGSAISAAVAAGVYPSFEEAQSRMTSLKEKSFTPDPSSKAVYDELYRMYHELHDTLGGVPGAKADLATLMKRLLAVRDRQAH